MLKLPPKKIIYNDQIELTLMSPRDAHPIYQGVISSLPELKQFMSWAHFDSDVNKACTIYADFEAKSLRGEEINFAGFDFHTGEFLFCCSLLAGSRLNPLAFEIGYWVSSPNTGKGLGTIAVKILIALAFSEYQANRVSVVCNLENKRSLKVIENAGFVFEGVLRNYLIQPTNEMITNGYSFITDVQAFSITPKHIPSLIWFNDFNKKLLIIPYYSTS